MGKKGKKAAANAIPAALVVEAANESIAAVADGSAPNISLEKMKRKECIISSSYADVKEKELILQERKFESSEKGEAFVAEQHAKNSVLEMMQIVDN